MSTEKNKKLENLSTVMTLYSRRTFRKESFQWTKCVVKYLYDLYSHFSFNLLGFLVEVLEKGSPSVQGPVMTIIHSLLHYVDMAQASQTINADLLRTVAKFVESQHWQEAMKILKLAVTRSSTLVAPPSSGSASASSSMTSYWESSAGSNFAETDLYPKKELPGRTMEFTFDLSQTPLIGRKQPPSGSGGTHPRVGYAHSALYGSTSTATGSTLTGFHSSLLDDKESLMSSISSKRDPSGLGSVASAANAASAAGATSVTDGNSASCLSPRRSMSLTTADSAAFSGWKRPWMSQV